MLLTPKLIEMILIRFFVILLFVSSVQGKTASANISPNQISIGEHSELQIEVPSPKQPQGFTPPQIRADGLQIEIRSLTTQTVMVNFKITTNSIYNYLITPLELGRHTIPSVSFFIDSSSYKTPELSIDVTGPATDKPNQASTSINQKLDDLVKRIASEVNDPNAGKNGGPDTLTAIKLGGVTFFEMQGLKVAEIKRGDPLESLISEKIPTGTRIFPIRYVTIVPGGSEQKIDTYFYKDEYGDWNCVHKKY